MSAGKRKANRIIKEDERERRARQEENEQYARERAATKQIWDEVTDRCKAQRVAGGAKGLRVGSEAEAVILAMLAEHSMDADWADGLSKSLRQHGVAMKFITTVMAKRGASTAE